MTAGMGFARVKAEARLVLRSFAPDVAGDANAGYRYLKEGLARLTL